jgi:phenylacetate-CoA ligase
LRWLDTAESWAWFKKCWRTIYAAEGITAADRLFFPFSFGPFVGFWAAFETAAEMGCFCLPAGGMSTLARLHHLLDHRATAICCTPTYALRMAEVAREAGLELAGSAVRALIVAGEPGGCIPETRARIETAWRARVFDHTGMTEIGSCSFECLERPGGVHVNETEFIPEVVNPETGEPVPLGESGELVLTNLGRIGSPLI